MKKISIILLTLVFLSIFALLFFYSRLEPRELEFLGLEDFNSKNTLIVIKLIKNEISHTKLLTSSPTFGPQFVINLNESEKKLNKTEISCLILLKAMQECENRKYNYFDIQLQSNNTAHVHCFFENMIKTLGVTFNEESMVKPSPLFKIQSILPYKSTFLKNEDIILKIEDEKIKTFQEIKNKLYLATKDKKDRLKILVSRNAKPILVLEPLDSSTILNDVNNFSDVFMECKNMNFTNF